MSGIYLEPVGLLYGTVAREAIGLGAALPLAGTAIAFGAVRLWEGEPGNVKHAIVRISTIQSIDEPRVKELLDRLSAPRPPAAGVSLDRPRIMGIVNVTPDSFSDGGDHFEAGAAVEHARRLVAEGANIIEIGAESTRPGSSPVAAEEELGRLLPVLQGLSGLTVPVSVDTRKPEVMREAASAGAAVLNDVSSLTFAANSLSTAAELKKTVVLMHSQGTPETMQDNPVYKDAAIEVYGFLESRIEAATAAGLPRENIIADPGIGFGKTLAHNLYLLQSIALFHGLGVPLMTGVSRKAFIQRITGAETPKESTAGSISAAFDAVSQGVQIVRVHDVLATRQAIALWSSLRGGLNIATENT
ncbi:MAG: dihydropteroate synthase [Rhodomicrobium sp.]